MDSVINEREVIEIKWEGPCSIEEVINKAPKAGSDCGVYQIYGTHNIFGPNSLLYIGKAPDSFRDRISGHQEDWIGWEASEVQVYLGRLGGVDTMPKDRWHEWEKKIDRAERLLIYYCSPPYNSSGKKSHGITEPTIVFNYGRRNCLPMEVSTLYEESNYVLNRSSWKEYE